MYAICVSIFFYYLFFVVQQIQQIPLFFYQITITNKQKITHEKD